MEQSSSGRSGGMADAADSKSVARKGVWVQVPPPALLTTREKKGFLIKDSRPPSSSGDAALGDASRPVWPYAAAIESGQDEAYARGTLAHIRAKLAN